MADVEHSTLPDAELHETKGIASATAGQVLIADGAGSGTFQTASTFSTQHAGIIIIDNSTIIVVPVATDSTLHTAADYVPIPATLLAQDFNKGITFDINDAFVIAETGVYILQGWVSISSTGINNTVAWSFSKNGVFQAPTRPVIKTKLKVAGDIISAAGFGAVPLSAGDVIRPGLADDTGSNVTIHEASFFIRKISN